MLAEKLGTPVSNLFAAPAQDDLANFTLPSAQFKNAYAPVANLTTLLVHVNVPVQADITALFNYTACGLSVDVGYNFWGTACEKISIRNDAGPTRLASGNVWALKGDANVYGFPAANSASANPPANIPLSATENAATINSGTNNTIAQNPGVDNAQFAYWTSTNNADQIVVAPGENGGPTTQQRTSADPIFLSNANIDLKSGRTRGISNKIFAHISYTWTECEDIMPFIGIGGKAEFGARHGERQCISNGSASSATCLSSLTQPIIPCEDCRGCQKTNLSEWGVWIKGGIFWS